MKIVGGVIAFFVVLYFGLNAINTGEVRETLNKEYEATLRFWSNNSNSLTKDDAIRRDNLIRRVGEVKESSFTGVRYSTEYITKLTNELRAARTLPRTAQTPASGANKVRTNVKFLHPARLYHVDYVERFTRGPYGGRATLESEQDIDPPQWILTAVDLEADRLPASNRREERYRVVQSFPKDRFRSTFSDREQLCEYLKDKIPNLDANKILWHDQNVSPTFQNCEMK